MTETVAVSSIQVTYKFLSRPMSLQTIIERKIREALRPAFLEVVNESGLHNVPRGAESHFKITVVSAEFDDRALVARHRLLNALLKEELAGPVHALSLHTLTPAEWQARDGAIRKSPPCLGGSKAG